MKLVIVSGTPGSGKTSILLHSIKELRMRDYSVVIAKIDCIQTDDKRRFEKEKIPILVGIAGDMCPDHYSIYNTDYILKWGKSVYADTVIIETAGLCLRCAPYVDCGLAICAIDVTTGPNTPLKIGPMLTTADVIITTKGDLVSQAEREVFMERIYEINPHCKVIEANGLSGKGAAEISDIIVNYKKQVNSNMVLRHTPPLAICTLCTGEKRVDPSFHFGVLRTIGDKTDVYQGE